MELHVNNSHGGVIVRISGLTPTKLAVVRGVIGAGCCPAACGDGVLSWQPLVLTDGCRMGHILTPVKKLLFILATGKTFDTSQ